tara:strand:+ start:366 stop:1223 length:858 start_codon:yes stop_codon:yes gene_type:complete
MVKYSKKNNAGLKCFTVPTGKVVCAKKSRFKPYDINKDKRLKSKPKKKMMATRIQQRVRKQKELKDKPKKKKAGSKIVKKLKSKLKVIKAKKVLKKKKINKAIKGAVKKAVVLSGGFFDDGTRGTTSGSTKDSKIFKMKFIKKHKKTLKAMKKVSSLGKYRQYKNLYDELINTDDLYSYPMERLKDIIKNKDELIAKGQQKKSTLRAKEVILEKYKLALKDKSKKVVMPDKFGFQNKDADARKLSNNMYDFYKVFMREDLRVSAVDFEAKIIKAVGKRRLKKFNL